MKMMKKVIQDFGKKSVWEGVKDFFLDRLLKNSRLGFLSQQ